MAEKETKEIKEAENKASSQNKKEKKLKDKKERKFNSKKFKHGAMATAFTCVFIAVVVLVNVVATILFDRFPITIDLTENKIYSVSEDARDYIEGINKEVTVTVLATEDAFENVQYGYEYTRQANQLLQRYTMYNGNINVRYVDYLSNPDILSDYTETQSLEQYDIIFETKSTDEEGNEFRRIKVVEPMDLINLTDEIEEQIVSYYGNKDTFIQYSGGSYQTFIQCCYYGMAESSNAESAFTSALMSVADENPVKVTFLNSDRNETELSYFKSLLEANAYVVEEINISTEEIPEDTNIIVIPAPKIDYTAEEIEKVDTFLDNDTRLGKNLLYMASIEQGDTPNIDEFLEEYGIEITHEVIGETDQSKYYYGNQYATVQYVIGENYLDGFSTDSLLYMPFARVVNLLYDEDGMKRTEAYVSSSTSASAVDIDTQETEERGALYSMAIGSKVRFADDLDEDEDNVYSHVLAFGTDYFFMDNYLGASQFKNSDFIITLFNEITDKTEGVVITPKAVGAVTFDINEKQANTLKYAYVVVIPAIILITGLVIYLRRKNK